MRPEMGCWPQDSHKKSASKRRFLGDDLLNAIERRS